MGFQGQSVDFFVLHPSAQSGVHHSMLLDQRFASEGVTDNDSFEVDAVIAVDDGLGAWQLFFNQMLDVLGVHGAKEKLENRMADGFKPGSFQSSDSQVK